MGIQRIEGVSFRETVWPLPGCLAGWLRDLHQDKTNPGRCRFQSPVGSGIGGMIMIALTLSSMFALAFAAPAPQELTVTVGDSSEGVEEPGPVVVVVDSSDGGPLDFGGLGDLGTLGGFLDSTLSSSPASATSPPDFLPALALKTRALLRSASTLVRSLEVDPLGMAVASQGSSTQSLTLLAATLGSRSALTVVREP